MLVNPSYTSKKCSNCGCVVDKLKLSDRVIFLSQLRLEN
nr:zinc ribbon domain-containing protein [Methanothermococcus sp.]